MSRVARPLAMVFAALGAAAIMILWIRSYSVSGRDLETLVAILRWWTLPVLLALLAAHVALAACRWANIETALGAERPSFRRAFTAGAMALGLGTVLPGLLTNVAARSLCNRLGGTGAIRGAVSGTIDQIADLAVVILFLPAAIIGLTTRSLPIYLAAVAASAAAGFAALRLVPAMVRAVSRFSIVRHLGNRAEMLVRPQSLRPIYGLSLLRFVCLTAMTVLIHFATGAATVGAAIIAIPLVTLAISLAMLPGGFGVSEWSFSAVFAAMGIGHKQIVLFVLGNRILLSALALLLMVLAVCQLAGRARRPRTTGASALI